MTLARLAICTAPERVDALEDAFARDIIHRDRRGHVWFGHSSSGVGRRGGQV